MWVEVVQVSLVYRRYRSAKMARMDIVTDSDRHHRYQDRDGDDSCARGDLISYKKRQQRNPVRSESEKRPAVLSSYSYHV